MSLHSLTHSKSLHPNSTSLFPNNPSEDKSVFRHLKLMKHTKHVKAKETFFFLELQLSEALIVFRDLKKKITIIITIII